jgi:DNA-binding sugar fermentation-stimulating protein
MSLTKSEIALKMRTVGQLLSKHYFRFGDEIALQDGIAELLTGAGIAFDREDVFDPESRFDFLLDDGIVIEVKMNGPLGQALRQVDRYLKLEGINGVILVSTCAWARNTGIMREYSKKLELVYLRRSAL